MKGIKCRRVVRYWVWVSVLTFWLGLLPAQAGTDVLELSEPVAETDLRPYMQYKLVAEGADDTLAAQLADSSGYQFFDQGSANLGYSTEALWVRWQVRNTTGQPLRWVLNTRLTIVQNLTLFKPSAAGYQAVQTGSLFPYDSRDIATDILAFTLLAPPHSEQVYYLRIQSDFALRFPFLMQSETRYQQFMSSHIHAYSFFFGVMIAQALYNLLLFFNLRDLSYLWYVGFVVSAILARALSLGLCGQVWPDFLQSWQFAMLYVCLNAGVLFAMLFARQFLNLHCRTGWASRLSKIAIVWTLVLVVLSVFTFGNGIGPLMNISALVINLMIVFLCLSVWRTYRPARFLLIGWLGMLLGGSTVLLMNLGLVPMNDLTTQAFPVGLMVDAMALSFALADRIRLLREEKDLAQQQLTEGLIEARGRLEHRVAQRTRQLAQARKEAERAITVKNRYLQLISHDIRSPLTSLKMLQGLMEQSPDKHAELLQHSGPLLDQVVGMIDQLGHVRQIDSQQPWRLEPERVPLKSLVEKRLKTHQQTLQAKQLLLDTQIEDDALVWAELWLLGGVLDNLIGNAIKFSRQGQTIKILGPRPGCTLTVCDQGVGMDTQMTAQLFKQPVSSRTGTAGESGQGYGLVLCREIVEAHGGRLWCESAPGLGSCFMIELPSEMDIRSKSAVSVS